MDLLLESPALRMAGAALATAISVSALAHATRKWGKGRWATTSALLLGAEDATRGDLRFAAVVAALAAGLAWVVALDVRLRELAPASRGLALAIGLPSIALFVAALADMLAAQEELVPVAADDLRSKATGLAQRAGFTTGQSEAIGTAVRAGEVAYGAATAVATNPTVRACASAVSGAAVEAGKSVLAVAVDVIRPKKKPQEVRALLDQAAAEVAAARARAEDASTRDALASMEEALASYAAVLEEPGADLERIARAAAELVALARSCGEDDGAEAFRALGVRRDARAEDIERIFRALARIYHADAGVPGVDGEKFIELTAAYERVRAYLNQETA